MRARRSSKSRQGTWYLSGAWAPGILEVRGRFTSPRAPSEPRGPSVKAHGLAASNTLSVFRMDLPRIRRELGLTLLALSLLKRAHRIQARDKTTKIRLTSLSLMMAYKISAVSTENDWVMSKWSVGRGGWVGGGDGCLGGWGRVRKICFP